MLTSEPAALPALVLVSGRLPAPRPGGVPDEELRLGQPERDVRPSSSARMRGPLRKGPGQVSLRHEPWFERKPAGEPRVVA